MKAMILAAGRGERMRPLTDTKPKPLLCVGGKPLIVFHLEKLGILGVTDVVINVAYLEEQIRQALGDGSRWGLSIHYSIEEEALETAGALLHALPLLGDEPFLLVNGDVWTDMDFAQFLEPPALGNLIPESLIPKNQEPSNIQAQLILVPNPDHNPEGDFSLGASSMIEPRIDGCAYTFSGIAVIHPNMIRHYPKKRERFPLKEVFDYYIECKQLIGRLYEGRWCDVGTPERLSTLDHSLSVII